jgi:hypothetical protein
VVLPPVLGSADPDRRQAVPHLSGNLGHQYLFDHGSLRQQLKRDLMPRPHDAEVAAVEGCHFGGPKPLGHGDHRGVNRAQRQIPVLSDELGVDQARFRVTVTR